MFQASMRWASTSATPQARACSQMRRASTARRSGVSFLESSRPTMRRLGFKITAAATTGPNSDPRPASSSPAMRIQPRLRAALDACRLALAPAEVVELGAAHAALIDHFDRADGRRVHRKNALDADTETDAPHGEARPCEPAALADHHALKRLDSLFFPFDFLQTHVDPHGIARTELGEVFSHLRLLEFFDHSIHGR